MARGEASAFIEYIVKPLAEGGVLLFVLWFVAVMLNAIGVPFGLQLAASPKDIPALLITTYVLGLISRRVTDWAGEQVDHLASG